MPYPDWVLKHKKKGTYVNCIKGKYYLYAAHSERVPGTKKVRRVCDGYLGRITEEDGFIPSKEKVTTAIQVFEFGWSYSILFLCENIHKGFKKTAKKEADRVMVASILTVVHGTFNQQLFSKSYLSILFPRVQFDVDFASENASNVSRGAMMIRTYLDKTFANNLTFVSHELSSVFKVRLNGKWYLSEVTCTAKELLEKYQIDGVIENDKDK